MAGKKLSVELEFSWCVTCGIPYAAPVEFFEGRRVSKRVFYCPNGHRESFVGDKPEELVKRVSVLEDEVGSLRVEKLRLQSLVDQLQAGRENRK